jgi:amino acid transporter
MLPPAGERACGPPPPPSDYCRTACSRPEPGFPITNATQQPAAPTGPDQPANGGAGLGTFAGVFTPSILTILGIILFLRLGYLVGSSGLKRVLLVLVVAKAISVLTSLSVAAVSTNLRVKGGGDYYLISRTLGLGFGGAIGLVLFLAQSVSVGFYCMGFAEAVAALVPGAGGEAPRVIAGVAVLGLFALAWKGADWATRFQYVVLATLVAALVTLGLGGAAAWNRELLAANWDAPASGLSFWVAFAIFFPAVTGFTQGVSMSGDLEQPARSIPRGVLSAVAVSIVVYVGCAVLMGGTLPGDVLRGDYLAMKRVASFAPLIDAGIVAATLSSALASFLGAPRILQSLSRDEVFPTLQPFAAGSGPSDNPRRAVLLTGGIAVAVIALGDLNRVAPIVSMFFLISYGLLNYATYFEARIGSPSFRPTFRVYHPRVGLAGAILCGVAMLAIDPTAGAVAAAIVFGIYQYLEYRAVPARWADVRRSHHLYETRQHLLAAAAAPEHPRDWRPQLLVFSSDAERRQRLLRVASWVAGGTGLTTVVTILEGEGPEILDRREQALEELAAEIKAGEHTAFPLVVAGPDLDQTLSTVIQAAGIGPLRANTVIANWAAGSTRMPASLGAGRYGRNLRTAFRLGCNLLVLDASAAEWEALQRIDRHKRTIDIWWRPNTTGELMLLLGHMVTRTSGWDGARIRVLADRRQGKTPEELAERLAEALDEYRIDAEVIVSSVEGSEIVRQSRNASLVFLPFSIHGDRLQGLAGNVADLLSELPITLLALAAQDVDLAADPDQEPDEVEEPEEPAAPGPERPEPAAAEPPAPEPPPSPG